MKAGTRSSTCRKSPDGSLTTGYPRTSPNTSRTRSTASSSVSRSSSRRTQRTRTWQDTWNSLTHTITRMITTRSWRSWQITSAPPTRCTTTTTRASQALSTSARWSHSWSMMIRSCHAPCISSATRKGRTAWSAAPTRMTALCSTSSPAEGSASRTRPTSIISTACPQRNMSRTPRG